MPYSSSETTRVHSFHCWLMEGIAIVSHWRCCAVHGVVFPSRGKDEARSFASEEAQNPLLCLIEHSRTLTQDSMAEVAFVLHQWLNRSSGFYALSSNILESPFCRSFISNDTWCCPWVAPPLPTVEQQAMGSITKHTFSSGA